MKIQGFTIIFALVAIPIILVLTYYVQLQVKTITLQSAYDSKLLDATYDAMSSFEINTANEDLSSVADSLRTIIEASNNVFFNTLSTNLGLSNASKAYVEPYIPAILYTLYDGYYISSPTQVPIVCSKSNGQAVSVGDIGVSKLGNDYIYNEDDENFLSSFTSSDQEDYGQLLFLKKDSDENNKTYTTKIDDAKKENKTVLKSYMPYSARYQGEDFDITVIYTLDNYVTIRGTIGGIYYTKSGYLIPDGLVESATLNDDKDLLLYNQNEAEDLIKKRWI